MNYIDIAVIGLLVLGLLFSLVGKASKKIFAFIGRLGGLVFAYLITPTVYLKLATVKASTIPFFSDAAPEDSVVDYIKNYILNIDIVKKLYDNVPDFKTIVDSAPEVLVKIVLFLVIGILSVIIFALIFKIIGGIFTKKNGAKKNTAILTFGLPGILSGAVWAALLLFPIVVVSPILKDAHSYYPLMANDSMSESDKTELESKFTLVEEQASSSFVLEFYSKTLNDTRPSLLTYSNADSTQDYYFIEEIDNISVFMPSFIDLFGVIKNNMSSLSSSLSSSSYSDKIDAFADLLDALDAPLTKFDTARSSISSESQIANLLSDLMRYFLVTFPNEEGNDSVSFLKKANFTGVDFKTISIKNSLLGLVGQAFLDEMLENNTGDFSFLNEINLSNMTYDNMKVELRHVSNLIKFYEAVDTNELSSISRDEIIEMISNLDDSEVVKEIVSSCLDELGIEGVNADDINFQEEAQVIADLIQLSQDGSIDDLDVQDINELVEELASSQLVLAIAENNSGMLSSLDDSTKNDILNSLEEYKNNPDNEMDDDRYNTLLQLFS